MDMTSDKRTDANHVSDTEIGGRAQRSHALVVLPPDWHFRPDHVPATRADCPPMQADTPTPGRLCPFIHCTHNLWLVAGADRPGRRWKGSRGENTLNLYTPHNCELDANKGGEMPPARVAEVLGCSDRQVRRKAKSGREKLVRNEKARRTLKGMVEK